MTTRVGSFGAPFSNESKYLFTEYDFASDTGATGDYALTAAAENDLMVRLVAVKTETAPTSGGAALLTLESDATADAFLNSEPIASFTAGGVFIPENATTGGTEGFVKVAETKKLQFSIEAAALTAGKMTMVWEVMEY